VSPVDPGRPLTGRVAIVTGGSRGIGRAIALLLSEHGADVVISYFRQSQAAEVTVAAMRARGVRAIAARVHLGEIASISALITRAVAEMGRLDVLVCNAASGVFRPLLSVDDQAWEWTMDVTARSVLACARLATPAMEAGGGGRIVTIGSAGAARVLPMYGMTGIAKAAVQSLTRYLAAELAPKGIIVNSVEPGIVATDSWRAYCEAALPNDPNLRDSLESKLVPAEHVAQAVAFLCRAQGIVGQTLVVDNGSGLTR
jgi:enoyl-[acyl-carrier protein] reductase III